MSSDSSYVLLLGPDCRRAAWEAEVADLPDRPMPVAVPVDVRQLPADLPVDPYGSADVVLVRPDGIIAGRSTEAAGRADLTPFEPNLPIVPSGDR